MVCHVVACPYVVSGRAVGDVGPLRNKEKSSEMDKGGRNLKISFLVISDWRKLFKNWLIDLFAFYLLQVLNLQFYKHSFQHN